MSPASKLSVVVLLSDAAAEVVLPAIYVSDVILTSFSDTLYTELYVTESVDEVESNRIELVISPAVYNSTDVSDESDTELVATHTSE